MKHRIVSLLLALVFLCACACAETLPKAANSYDYSGTPGYTIDETTGEWVLEDSLFAAVLDSVTAGELRNYQNTGTLLFSLRLTGNARTQSLRPELVICYCAAKPIDIKGLSILVDGIRYDLETGAGKSVTYGTTSAEYCTAMLTGESLKAIYAMAKAESVQFLMQGAKSTYTCTIARTSGTNAKEELQSACLQCLSLADKIDTGYTLWDISEAEWKKANGKAPVSCSYEAAALDVIAYGDKTQAVSELQEALIAAGFYVGAKEASFGEKTSAAVLRAQKAYALPATGCADEHLISILKNGIETAETAAQTSGTPVAVGDLTLTMDRWRTADEYRTSSLSAAISVSDSDNTFAIVEGTAVNDGRDGITISWYMNAELIVNGVSFDCICRAECNNGSAFTTTLLPFAQSKLLILTEIPENAIAAAQSIVLRITCGEAQTDITILE